MVCSEHDPGPFAERRRATLVAEPGAEYRAGSPKDALADVRTGNGVSCPAAAGHTGPLAHYHLHQFRPLRPFQCDRGEQPDRRRAVGFGRDLLDLGHVQALLGADSDFQRSVALRPCASRRVAEEHNMDRTIYIAS